MDACTVQFSGPGAGYVAPNEPIWPDGPSEYAGTFVEGRRPESALRRIGQGKVGGRVDTADGSHLGPRLSARTGRPGSRGRGSTPRPRGGRVGVGASRASSRLGAAR